MPSFSHIEFNKLSPLCPNGVCPISCPNAIASIKSSFNFKLLPIVLAIFETN